MVERQSALTGTVGLTKRNNSGGGATGSWTADSGFSGGTSLVPSPAPSISTTGVSNPAPTAVYQTGRQGNSTYTYSGFVAGVNSVVRLHFAEIGGATSGQRRAKVTINNQTVLSSFDIYATAGGANKANVQSYTLPADASGRFVIQFSTVSGSAKSPLVSGIEITPPAPCMNGAAASQTFNGDMVGCKGTVTFANRATLCGSGYHVATATEWATFSNKIVPTHNYWTDDNLNYWGSGPANCAAATLGMGSTCDQPMRVCTATGTDPEGNVCNWTKCGLDSRGPNFYFGGCSGNTTAGTLCVRSLCANGEAVENFGGGMIGCRGSETQSNSGTLCATDHNYHEASNLEWEEFRANHIPAHDYWTSNPPSNVSGSSAMCAANYSGGTVCSVPLHPCTASGAADASGNVCAMTQCGFESNTPDLYLGGCTTGTTAGAVCVHGNPIGCHTGLEATCQKELEFPTSSPKWCAGIPWPNGIIYYEWIDSDPAWQNEVRTSMTYWETITGNRIRFVEDAGKPARVRFTCRKPTDPQTCDLGGVGGLNPIGYASGDEVDGANDLVSTGTIYKLGVTIDAANPLPPKLGWDTHELGHVIGFAHEQQRGDRDRYTYRNPATYANSGYEERCGVYSPGFGFGIYDGNSTMSYGASGPAPARITTVFKRSDMLTPANNIGNDLLLADAKDASNVIERYASMHAWTKWYPMGADLGEHAPAQVEIPSPPATSATIKIWGRPAVASQGGFGNVDIYMRGNPDKHIYRSWITGGWETQWEDLGGTYDSEPAATSMGPGSSIVLAAKGSAIQWRQLTQSGWGSWTALPALPVARATGSGPAIVNRGSNEFVAFYRATDNSIYQSFYVAGWTSWSQLPAVPAGVTLAASPGAVAQSGTTFDVFVTTTAGHILHLSYDNQWATSWEDVAANAKATESPAAASWGKGRVDLFYQGTDTLLYGRRWQQGWLAVEPLGGIMHSSPAAVAPKAGRIEVYALGEDDGLWRRVYQPAKNDFDGDGKADMAVYRDSDTSWHIIRSSDGVETTYQLGTATDKPAPGDFDGDGTTDRTYFRDGTWQYVYSVNDLKPKPPVIWGTNNDRPAPGDYDGDGLTDPALFRPSTFTWWVAPTSGAPVMAILWGTTGDIPVPADYDGDGKTDIAVVHTNLTWGIRASGPTPIGDIQYGAANDIPVPADYDGDGKADLAVFRPAVNEWHIRLSSTGGDSVITFGAGTNVVPQPADYDGDGKADPAFLNKNDNNWYVLPSSGIVMSPYLFSSGDKPVTYVLAP